YRIYLNGQEAYNATSSLFKWMAQVQVFKVGSDFPAVSIRQQWAWFKAKYNIKFEGGTQAAFTTVSFWKNHYQCYVGGSRYEVFGHRGRKYSVYKDGRQIAWWDKAAVSWFNGDNYHLLADDRADHELLIAFCLILDHHTSNRKGDSGITVDFGNFGPQAKAFDPAWRPKEDWKGEGQA
ncbi:MAG: hypothetical protein ACO1OQ_05480, partial [Rufibacter sp.]